MGIVIRQSVRSTFFSYLGGAIAFVNKIVLLTHFLTADKVGLINVMLTMAAMYAQITIVGMPHVFLRFFPFFKDKSAAHNGILIRTLGYSLFAFLLFTGAYLILSDTLTAYFGQKSPLLSEYFFYVIPLAFAIHVFNILDAYLRSLFKTVVPIFIREVLQKLILTLSISLYALKLVNFKTFVIVFIALYLGTTLVLLLYTAFLKQFFIRSGPRVVWKKYRLSIINYAFFSFTAGLSTVALSLVDTLMLAGNLNVKGTEDDLGIYTTMIFLTVMLMVPWRAIAKVASPLVAEHWKNNKFQDLARLYKRTSLVNIFIGLLLFFVLWINVTHLFAFLPPIFNSGKYALLFLGIAKLVEMITGLNGVILSTSKYYYWDLVLNLLLIATAIGTNLYFIPRYGLSGAAFATMLSHSFLNILRLVTVAIIFKVHPFSKNMLWLGLFVTIALLVNYLIPSFAPAWVDVLMRTTAFLAIFGLPSLLTKAVPDVNAFLDKLRRRISR